ncbi:MAG: AMP-binding protein, partial [Jannaschia sp.]
MRFWDDLAAHGEHPALITENGPVSHAGLAARADALHAGIAKVLPRALSRPLVLLEACNTPESIVAYVAALRAGWPVILVAEGAAGDDTDIVRLYRPNVILRADDGWIPTLASSSPVVMHPETAVLLSTSGTTGAAKLVRLSRDNLTSNAAAIASYLDVGPQDRALTLLPFHYSYGLSVLHIHLLRGAALVLTEGSLIDAGVRAFAVRHGVTTLALVPTQFELLAGTDWLATLRTVTQAGGL